MLKHHSKALKAIVLSIEVSKEGIGTEFDYLWRSEENYIAKSMRTINTYLRRYKRMPLSARWLFTAIILTMIIVVQLILLHSNIF